MQAHAQDLLAHNQWHVPHTWETQKRGRDDSYGKNDDTVVEYEIGHQDQHHWAYVETPVPLDQSCAWKTQVIAYTKLQCNNTTVTGFETSFSFFKFNFENKNIATEQYRIEREKKSETKVVR